MPSHVGSGDACMPQHIVVHGSVPVGVPVEKMQQLAFCSKFFCEKFPGCRER